MAPPNSHTAGGEPMDAQLESTIDQLYQVMRQSYVRPELQPTSPCGKNKAKNPASPPTDKGRPRKKPLNSPTTSRQTPPAPMKNALLNLSKSLSTLERASRPASLPLELPPELIDYVASSRNPDIYSREFVEVVQAKNKRLREVQNGLGILREELVAEIGKVIPEMSGKVKREEK